MPTEPAVGLLLLTGGRGRRLGGPKHLRAHPSGATWGGHLIAVFQAAFPEGPVQVLGEPLGGWPCLADPGQGPAVALRHWLAQPRVPARRWWVAACDQVRWDAQALARWHGQAEAADPQAAHWVLALHEGIPQYLGGFLGAGAAPPGTALAGQSLRALAEQLPTLRLQAPDLPWADVDTPEQLKAWLGDPDS